jgi:DNA repair ATPase RecN
MAATAYDYSRLLEVFEIAAALHEETLTKLKSEALVNKNRCNDFLTGMAQDYQKSADAVQAQIDLERQKISDLRPIIQEMRQLEEKSTVTKPPVKQPAKKITPARKEGRA